MYKSPLPVLARGGKETAIVTQLRHLPGSEFVCHLRLEPVRLKLAADYVI